MPASTRIYVSGAFAFGGQPAVDDLLAAGYNTVIVWSVHVAPDGSSVSVPVCVVRASRPRSFREHRPRSRSIRQGRRQHRSSADGARNTSRAHRGTVSVPDRRVCSNHRALSQRHGNRLVPRGAAEPGCLVSDPAPSPGAVVRAARVVLRGPAWCSRAGFRHPRIARPSATGAGRRSTDVTRPRSGGSLHGQ